LQRTATQCATPVRGKRAVGGRNRTLPDGTDVDVFSDSITVFELDTRKLSKLHSLL
jgi:hypothetical protein